MDDPRAVKAIVEYGAQQKVTELSALLGFLEDREIHNVLEVGSWTGGTLWLWEQIADGLIVSVDMEEIPSAHLGPRSRLVRGDSHKYETRALVPPANFQLVFIDGDHTDAGVRHDYSMYAPLVAPGGLIAIHDIVWHPPNSGIYVEEFWTELKKHERTIEFIDPHRCELSRQVKDDAGIGVVLCR
jgi:predicted O-methyltransferase YrrM